MKKHLYHGSITSNIQFLEAKSKLHNSSNKVVYLTGSIPYALVYIWDANRLKCKEKFVTSGIRDGQVFYEELFPNQLKTFYQGVSGYLYCIEQTDNMGLVENRESMYFSLKDVPVDRATYIEDVYEALLSYEKEGKFKVYRFNETTKEKQEELIERIAVHIINNKLLEANDEEADFMKRYFVKAWELAIKIEKRNHGISSIHYKDIVDAVKNSDLKQSDENFVYPDEVSSILAMMQNKK